ncbi:hypothetical protein OG21DRAFT_1528315, partial [Imleria badia]
MDLPDTNPTTTRPLGSSTTKVAAYMHFPLAFHAKKPRADHPADPNAFPDQVDGALVTEGLTGTTDCTTFVGDEPLMIDESPFPDPTTPEDNASCSKDGSWSAMDMDIELPAQMDKSDLIPCGQTYTFTPLNVQPPLTFVTNPALDCHRDIPFCFTSSPHLATAKESDAMAEHPPRSMCEDESYSKHCPLPDMDVDPEVPTAADSSTAPLLLDPMSAATDSAIAKTLLAMGINLTICLFYQLPIYYLSAHTHYISNHKPATHSRSCIPSREEVNRMLLQLKADHPSTVFPRPMPQIPGLKIFNTVKCEIPRCHSPFVFSDRRRFNEHCAKHHDGIPRVSSNVKAHKLSNMRTAQQMVEIIPSPTITTTCPESLVDDLEAQLSSLQLYALPDVFQPSFNERSKGALFAQLGWDHLLVAIRIHDLRSTVTIPPASDPYNCLTLSVQ